jgi:hypothetical protein
MKKLLMFGFAVLPFLPLTVRGTQTAHATLFCWSLRFHQGVDSFGDSTLDLTGQTTVVNGELVPWYSTYTHRSGFLLDWMGFSMGGTLYLDLPTTPDANDDGFDDSFEVSQAVSGTSYGQYATPLGGGLITATWSRAANSKDGTCSLHLVDNTYGDLGVYYHAFEVLESTGPLTYTPGTNTVSASVNLTNATDQLQGSLSFAKSAANPYNQLTLAAGGWTNAALQVLAYASRTFYRDASWPTNYYGMVVFDDGDLNTSAADYRSWELSIDDLNDTDHDGIPDFSDDPAAAAPRRPKLTLTRGTTNLWLAISGDTNHVHRIQEITNALSTNWQTIVSLTLTNDPQTVSLPEPTSSPKFWRGRAE